ncbi:MAG TPA: Gfo/Idh/MocA family oxidoreductase [Roseiflexaceae bacterium]|nr:Gfo/Idh/MocA family oxidoreductase [Roseiflexaceae bacterium]
MNNLPVGVLGCGQISSIYLQNCSQGFGILEVAAVADLLPELARKRAEEFQIARACTVDELLADPAIEIILNLTSPQVHAEVNSRILRAGKHVYTEKPFALTREDADAVFELGRAKGLRVGCAPDTFLGAGLQTCRKLIDEGAIGTPYAASALILMGNVYDGMHPNAQYYLQLGWDPLFDMAPYYLTALVTLLGPARRVAGSTTQVRHEITMRNPESPRYGQTVPVAAPMNAAATLDFESGVIATLQAAKESFGYTPRLEIYGTEGILFAPDPNTFGGAIRIQRPDGSVTEIPYSHGFSENSRGLGVADMAYAIRSGRPHRASEELASHVLDITLGIFESSRAERHMAIHSRCERPAPLPAGLMGNPLA